MRLLQVLVGLLIVTPALAVEVGVSGPSVWNGDAASGVRESQAIAATGAAWTRVAFRLDIWNAPDDATPRGPQKLTWFQAYDQVIDYLTTHGVQVYGEIGGGSVPGGVGSAADQTKYADAFLKIVDHFKNRVRVYETFNEPNNWKPGTTTPALSPDDLAQIQQSIYLKAKWGGRQTDSCNDVTIVLGAILACCGGNGADYLNQYYQAGRGSHAFDWMHANVGTYPNDGFGYHPYMNASDMQAALNGFWGVVTSQEGAGTSKQVWASEFGVALGSSTSQQQQAQVLTDSYNALSTFPHLAAGLWFTFSAYAGYGLVDAKGNPLADYSRFVAAANQYAPPRHAMFVADDVPAQLAPGEQRTVSLTVKNIGGNSWDAAGAYRLGAASGCPAAAVTNQVPMQPTAANGYAHNPLTDVRVFLPSGATIKHGGSTTFQIDITAPTQLGSYTLGARMVQDNVAFFGDTFRKTVLVAPRGLTDGGAPGDGGTIGDGGVPVTDGSVPVADGGEGGDGRGGRPDFGALPASPKGGCSYAVASGSSGRSPLLLTCLLVLAVAVRRRASP